MKTRVQVRNYILAFLIPILVMTFVAVLKGFYPFGGKSVFIMDMQDQYLEFYASLRNMWNSDDSLFFSWSRSLGGNYVGLFAYYIASPLSWLTVLFPLQEMSMAIWIMTILKIGLCGLSFYHLGSYVVGKCMEESKAWAILFLAVGYALCSYNMVYSMCPMWLDGVVFLPLIIKGLLQIIQKEKTGVLYICSLAAAVICDYYIGYMICIFVVLFYFFILFQRMGKGEIKSHPKLTMQILVKSVLAVGLTMPLMIPNLISLRQGRMSEGVTFFMCRNFHLSRLWTKFLPGCYDSIKNEGLPSIYCGIFALVLLCMFFASKNIQRREKLGGALGLCFLIGSFYACPVDMIWHGFHYPMWFPYRYAFIFSFFLLYLDCRLLKEATWKWKKTNAIRIAVGILAMLDMTYNSYALVDGLDREFGYLDNQSYVDYIQTTGKLVQDIQAEDAGFYRINENYEFSKNDALLLGYHGLTHYSSTYNREVNNFCKELGMAQSQIWNSGYGSTPVTNAFFAVKYILDEQGEPSAYQKIATIGQASAYENKVYLPIAYAVADSCTDLQWDQENPFVNQNELMRALTNQNLHCFEALEWKELPVQEQDDTYVLTYEAMAASKNPVYLYLQSADASYADIYVNNQLVGHYFSSETRCNLYLGEFSENETIEIKCVLPKQANMDAVYIYQLNMTQFEEGMKILSQNPIDLRVHTAGTLTGNIRTAGNQRIMTSIPYDAGWHVYIDGKETETEKYAGTFLTVRTEAGDHTITFRYIAPGFGWGMLVFAISLIRVIILKKKK